MTIKQNSVKRKLEKLEIGFSFVYPKALAERNSTGKTRTIENAARDLDINVKCEERENGDILVTRLAGAYPRQFKRTITVAPVEADILPPQTQNDFGVNADQRVQSEATGYALEFQKTCLYESDEEGDTDFNARREGFMRGFAFAAQYFGEFSAIINNIAGNTKKEIMKTQ